MALIFVADVSLFLAAESLLGRTRVFLGTNGPFLGAKMLLGTDRTVLGTNRTVLGIYLFPGTREGPTAALSFDLDSGCHRDRCCLFH